MYRKFLSLVLFALACLGLSACSAFSTPRRIASYPANSPPIASPPQAVIYTGSLELEVYDPEAAAQAAIRIVSNNGGYLVNSYTGYRDGRRYACLTLAVPSYSFEAVRVSLLNLGDLVSENLSGQLQTTYYPEAAFSHITLTLLQAPVYRSTELGAPDWGWDPSQTLSQAWRVFLSIFHFLADILIWVVVVVGPFVLMAWGAWALIRRRR